MKRKRTSNASRPSKKQKRTYNKKFVKKATSAYRSVSRKSNTVNSLVGKKHVKAGRKYVKSNPKLDRRIRLVAQKQAMKDLPIYDCKETFLGSLSSSIAANGQLSTDVFTPTAATAGGVDNDAFHMLTKQEIASLILKGFAVTNSTAQPIKCNVQYAKKSYTITNNTFAYVQFSVLEYVYDDDSNSLPRDEWIAGIASLPKITGGAAQDVDQFGQKPYDVKTWKSRFKYKEVKFELAPGASYTHTIYSSNIDIDLAHWNDITYKKGITKGIFLIYNFKQVGSGATGVDAAFAGVAATTAQITVRVDAHFKVTCPETAIETESVDKWFRAATVAAFVAPAISVFDRTALALNANV